MKKKTSFTFEGPLKTVADPLPKKHFTKTECFKS